MSEKEKEKEKFVHDSKFNRRLITLSEQYSKLMQIQLKEKLRTMKEGAWNIANNSKNPKLKEICKELDKLKLK